MKTKNYQLMLAVLIACFFVDAPLRAQSREEATVQGATKVLTDIMATAKTSIPQSMLADAHGLVIVPNVIKGGFVVGVRHGNGLAVIRSEQGGWQAPVFLSLTGGSVGFQAGLQSTDVILVFKTAKSVQGLMSGKFTIGADAAAAAGPVGLQAAAATDARLGAEIYSYCRSRGLFAGVALDGSALQIQQAETQAYYQAAAAAGAPVPPSAATLVEVVARYTTPATVPGANPQPVMVGSQPTPVSGLPTITASPAEPTPVAPGFVATPAPASAVAANEAAIRQQLGDAAKGLQGLLDENWKRYLALPAELYGGNGQASISSLQEALTHFDSVAANPQYAALSQRPEFQTAHKLLRDYVSVLTAESNGTLNLPPPPGQIPASPGAQPIRY